MNSITGFVSLKGPTQPDVCVLMSTWLWLGSILPFDGGAFKIPILKSNKNGGGLR